MVARHLFLTSTLSFNALASTITTTPSEANSDYPIVTILGIRTAVEKAYGVSVVDADDTITTYQVQCTTSSCRAAPTTIVQGGAVFASTYTTTGSGFTLSRTVSCEARGRYSTVACDETVSTSATGSIRTVNTEFWVETFPVQAVTLPVTAGAEKLVGGTTMGPAPTSNSEAAEQTGTGTITTTRARTTRSANGTTGGYVTPSNTGPFQTMNITGVGVPSVGHDGYLGMGLSILAAAVGALAFVL